MRPAIRARALAARRLDLIPLRADHADEMAGVLADPALHAFTGGTPMSPGALRARYARLAAGSPDPAVVWGNWVLWLRAEGRLVGTVQATIAPARDQAELAWVVGTPWQGRGLATEAARALAAWLTELPVGRLVAHIAPDHHASSAVAAACGLAPTPHREDGEIRWEYHRA
ncbi:MULTISPECIES: GNAT family N-acetyltransferase [unclassified Streptomyces]|uniref:GNAT family N-acetyltransferase n=1 Tax=unclassified Streptomyces TaxID=2593676 RepID=UPI001BE8C589|nr:MULTISPECIES: GNAT family N-acetyltransferase [unclassified Streptomyces]MBT2407136.1 GNAT family N-acetyltransferase [Streptomyces sp. ISL-21]MBT2612784.1 GNAT family N-acetyltransferase [Streptomyces sp. ISL-87]